MSGSIRVKFVSLVGTSVCYAPSQLVLLMIGYGQCSYIRLVISDRKINCCLQVDKSKVLPVRYVLMPMMELTAVALTVKVVNQLKGELPLRIDKDVF